MNESLTRPLKSLLRIALHTAALPFRPVAPRVLIYHSVDEHGSPISISPDLFARQMGWLVAKGYTTWTASRFATALRQRQKIPRRVVVLTFDDGYLNNITTALPILEQRGLCATMFMVTENDGDVPRWGERDKERIAAMVDALFPGNEADKARATESVHATLTERIATWDELRGAPERGFEILSHTRTHPYMDAVDDAQLRDELVGSKRDLEERGFGPCNAIAWPYGMHDDRAIAAAAEAGYEGTYLGEYFWHLRHHPDPMRICRIGADPSRGVFGLAFVLGRGYDWLQWLRRLKPRREY